jgi:hypothetical protein
VAVVAFFTDGGLLACGSSFVYSNPSGLPSILDELWPMTRYDSGNHDGIHTPVDRGDSTFCENNRISSILQGCNSDFPTSFSTLA